MCEGVGVVRACVWRESGNQCVCMCDIPLVHSTHTCTIPNQSLIFTVSLSCEVAMGARVHIRVCPATTICWRHSVN